MKKIKSIIALVIVATITGCSNYVRTQSTTTYLPNVVKEERVYKINVNENQLEEGIFAINVTVNTKREVEHKNCEKIMKYSTPYALWRELYEIPCGAVLLPTGIVLQVCDFFLLGMLPNRYIDANWDYCWSGLNPILNMESETRVKGKEVSSEIKVSDKTKEVSQGYASGETLNIILGDDVYEFTLDSKGELKLPVLLNQDFSDLLNGRQLKFQIKDHLDSKVEVIISRDLQNRFNEAKKIISNYRKEPTGTALYNCVIALEKLKLTKIAFVIERDELKKYDNDKTFQEQFKLAEQSIDNDKI